MKKRLEYLRIFLRYNGLKKPIETVEDINNKELDALVSDNSDIWFILETIRTHISKFNVEPDTKLDDIFDR